MDSALVFRFYRVKDWGFGLRASGLSFRDYGL